MRPPPNDEGNASPVPLISASYGPDGAESIVMYRLETSKVADPQDRSGT
jgi:hypothetical protein